MSPGDDHPEPPPGDVSPPAQRAWLDAYVDHRLAELDRELADDGGPPPDAPPPEPPPAPRIPAHDLARHLAELAARYRRRSA
jgi:hypothetical protein